jgi:hypothetical protein
MRTKEEIYKAHHTYAEFDLLPSKELTLKSMDEYAKEVAIAFAQWLVDDAYYAGQVNYETNQPKTTEELFNQFIKETITTA